MSKELSWDEWLATNIARNCNAVELHEILLKNGFSELQITSMLERANGAARSTPTYQDDFETHTAFFPDALKIETNQVDMYGIDGFLNPDECTQLIQLIRNNRRRSTTTEDGVSDFRTSTTCELDSLDHPIVQIIDQRICKYLGIDPCESEPIEGQWYEVGQEFKAHTDYFEPSSKSYDLHVGELGQRTWTFMIYLNNTREGGATRFTEIDLEIEPQAGTAILWNNVNSDGQPNTNTRHHGMPVKSGYKAIITKWFRSIDNKPRYKKEANEKLAPLTKSGFLKNRIPAHLHRDLLEYYIKTRHTENNEHIPDFIGSTYDKQPSVLIELTDDLRCHVHTVLQPIVEAWIGDYLVPTFVYGIREYRNGAVLKPHRDRIETHVASVILNIDQEVSKDWPLVIEDTYYRQHSIHLKPGEMLLYEGARLQHGRPEALAGKHYTNVFVHFKQP